MDQVRAGLSPDPDLASLNTVVLDGRQITVGDLQFACGTLPFLADRRLVIVERLLARLSASGPRSKGSELQPAGGIRLEKPAPGETESGRPADAPAGSSGFIKAWLDAFDQVPDLTELVLVEDDVVSGGAVLRRLLELQRAGRARISVFEKPNRRDIASLDPRARQTARRATGKCCCVGSGRICG